jgi:hypothetical protein
VLVFLAQPVHELLYLPVAPHPAWKPGESLLFLNFRPAMTDIAINACGIRPIRFHGHDIETMILDQVAGYGGPGAIEFTGAMGCLSQQDQVGAAKSVEWRTKCLHLFGRRQVGGGASQGCGQGMVGFVQSAGSQVGTGHAIAPSRRLRNYAPASTE